MSFGTLCWIYSIPVLFLMIGTIIAIRERKRQNRCSRKTTAIVTDIQKVHEFGIRYHYDVKMEFELEGNGHFYGYLKPGSLIYSVGEKVEVFYDPGSLDVNLPTVISTADGKKGIGCLTFLCLLPGITFLILCTVGVVGHLLLSH